MNTKMSSKSKHTKGKKTSTRAQSMSTEHRTSAGRTEPKTKKKGQKKSRVELDEYID